MTAKKPGVGEIDFLEESKAGTMDLLITGEGGVSQGKPLLGTIGKAWEKSSIGIRESGDCPEVCSEARP